jgi:hypothetical protein
MSDLDGSGVEWTRDTARADDLGHPQGAAAVVSAQVAAAGRPPAGPAVSRAPRSRNLRQRVSCDPPAGPPEAGRDPRHVSPPARPTQVVTAGRTARAATAGAGRRASQDLVDGVRRQRSCTCRVTGPPPCHGGRRNLSGCRTRRRPSPPVSPSSPLPAALTPTGPSSNRLAACGVSWWAAPRKRALGGPVGWFGAPMGTSRREPRRSR